MSTDYECICAAVSALLLGLLLLNAYYTWDDGDDRDFSITAYRNWYKVTQMKNYFEADYSRRALLAPILFCLWLMKHVFWPCQLSICLTFLLPACQFTLQPQRYLSSVLFPPGLQALRGVCRPYARDHARVTTCRWLWDFSIGQECALNC